MKNEPVYATQRHRSIKKAAVLLFVILMSLCLSACWNYRELESFSSVTGAAVDVAPDGNWEVTAEFVDYSISKAESGGKADFVTAEGKTIFDAIRNLITMTGNKLYWGHATVFILSKEAAKKGLENVMDFVMRDHEVRLSTVFVVSGEATAKEILTLETPNNAFRSYGIKATLDDMQDVSKTPMVMTHEVIEELSIPAQAQVLPLVYAVNINNKKMLAVNGCAYFKKGKLAGYLNGEDTMKMLFVSDEVKGGIVNIETANKPERNKGVGRVALEITKTKTQVKPTFDGKRFTFEVDINMEVTISDVETQTKVLSKENFEGFKSKAEQQLRDRILAFIQKVQSSGPDLIKFGMTVKRSMPSVWKSVENDWLTYFTAADVRVKAKINILNFAELQEQVEAGTQ